MANYFLMKSDPDCYSLDDLERDKETSWDGVHNYQAINVIKKMKKGDKVYIYHSLTEKKIVGLAEVINEPYQNLKDERFSWAVNIKFVKRYVKTVSLQDFKNDPGVSSFLLVKHSRLSVMEVGNDVRKWIEERVS